MVIVTDANGNLINNIPERVYQGSNNANSIVFMCPLKQAEADISFVLGDGTITEPYYMTKFDDLGDIQGELGAWTVNLDKYITQFYGTVRYQIRVYTGNGQIVPTVQGTFEVEKGTPPVIPEEPSATIYEQILTYLAMAGRSAKELLEYDDEFAYSLNAIVVTSTAVYKSLVEQNVGHSLNNTTYWAKYEFATPIDINNLQSQINNLSTTKQNITDNTLTTTSKTITGAINELEANKQNATDSSLNTTADTIVGAINELVSDISSNTNAITAIEELIPSQAGPDNPLADQNFVNSSINAFAAYYITRNADGDPFQTKAQLDGTSTFYSGGQVRVPTTNDYCLVIADITKADSVTGYTGFTTTAEYVGYYIIYNNENTLVTVTNKDSVGITAGTTPCYYSIPTTRYTYQGAQWEFQYIVNNTALTASQLAALNSGITAQIVEDISNLNIENGEGTNSIKMKNNNTVLGNNSFAEGSNNVIFGDNGHAEGLSVTKATSRGITTSTSDADIQTEWLASDPEGDKFSLVKGENSHIEGTNNLALGPNSHAEGNGTRAVNNSAHSEGTGTLASGKYSHAEGLETIASGGRAHTEGDSTQATADYTHAEGRSTKAYGKYAHVEGRDTQVESGKEYCHAEGRDTIASHSYCHVAGQGTKTSATHQTVVGSYNDDDSSAKLIVGTGSSNNSRRNSFVAGHDGSNSFIKVGSIKLTDTELDNIKQGGSTPQGVVSHSSTISSSGAGNAVTNMSIDSNGDVTLTKGITAVETSRTIAGLPLSSDILANSLKSSLGISNISDGTGTGSIIANDLTNNVASGDYCFAEGDHNTASGALGSHAEGYLNVASGSHSHAEGEENTASGQTSHVEGFKSVASGYGTHAEGGRCNATFEYAHAEGQFTTANGFASHSEGCQTITGTVARQSHAEGYFTEAHNYQSHAEGDYSIAGFNNDTVATFDISATYAEGTIVKNNTGLYYLCIKASTGNALDNTTYWNLIQSNHAEGQNTRSTSVASHAEGVNSIASGKASHAEGNGTYATNNAAHSEGTGSQATGKYSHAEGLESVASGSRSHAEGYTTTASGDSAHAQGRDTVASGKYSFAGGRGTTASKENQTALGQYNETDNESLLIVGTGSKSGDTVTPRNSFGAGHDGTESFIKVGTTKFRESEIAKKSDITNWNNVSNVNLLINGDFRVNQRGLTSYPTGQFSVDRWYLREATMSLTGANKGNPTVTATSANDDFKGLFYAFEDKDITGLLGKTVTLSAKISAFYVANANVKLRIGLCDATGGHYVGITLNHEAFTPSAGDIISVKIDIPSSLTNTHLNCYICLWDSDQDLSRNTDYFGVEWLKLEIGEIPTPFSPKKYAEELADCQRYYYQTQGTNDYGVLAIGTNNYGANIFQFVWQFPVTMRTDPTTTMSGSWGVYGAGAMYPITSLSYQEFSGDKKVIRGNVSSGPAVGSVGTLQRNADTTAKITFDAEIY